MKNSCDSIDHGFRCQPEISHFWGQYSPYFSAPSELATEVPDQCQITFAQILSRHGARDPTSGKTATYKKLVDRFHANATSYSKKYAFIKDYNYVLGADQLSVFGQQEMINSGAKFYKRYNTLTKSLTPFIRSAGQDRVVESAQNWTQGFHEARLKDTRSTIKEEKYPYNIVTINEDPGFNNTLSHGLCTAFESDANGLVAKNAQATWVAIFTPPITKRLNANLPGVNFTNGDTISMMDLCPFNTVADDYGTVSNFCDLFTEQEWKQYDYYETLGKYYGYGLGNSLGSTQGVGFANELIARMTDSAVKDHTTTNSTLDGSPVTFPVGGNTVMYADFSHDNDMTGIFSALGLYNATRPLLNTTLESAEQANGYASSWTVPFAARAYFEKMKCVGASEEYVRVVVNDRVLPLETCGGDNLGRCTLSAFVNSLSFAQSGGLWNKCFV